MFFLEQAKKVALSFHFGNAVRNAGQFSIMAALFYFYNNSFSLSDYLVGLIGFVMAYNFIYALNDVVDYKKDIRDRVKRLFKKNNMKSPLHTGTLTGRELIAGSVLVMFFGLAICYYVSPVFLAVVSLAIAANLMHSSGIFGVGRTLPILALNFMFMQAMKFASVWFTQTEAFDYRLVLPTIYMSVLYTMLYLGYKTGLGKRLTVDSKIFVVMASIAAIPLAAMLYQPEVLPVFAINMALTAAMFVSIARLRGGKRTSKMSGLFTLTLHLNTMVLISLLVAYGYLLHA